MLVVQVDQIIEVDLLDMNLIIGTCTNSSWEWVKQLSTLHGSNNYLKKMRTELFHSYMPAPLNKVWKVAYSHRMFHPIVEYLVNHVVHSKKV